MREKEILERKVENFINHDIPCIIKGLKDCEFVQHAVATMFESKSCYASTIARHMHHDGTTLKNREKKTLKQLENTNSTSLNELLCKDGLRHMRNKKFYVAIDVTPIEKAFAKYEKDPTKESPMEGLGIINTYDSKTNCTMNNLTLDELYHAIDHKCYIEFYGHDATNYNGYLKYKPCFLNGFHKLVNIVILDLDGKLSALLTTNYVGSDEDVKNSVYRYTRRWNIELIFGFIKKTFNMEKYLVRTLKKMINLILLMMITTNFYSNIWYMKSKLKNKLIELAEPFTTPTFGLELIVNGIKELYKPNIKVSSS